MNTRILLLVFLFFALIRQEVYSQFGFSHEIGVITGPVVFYSDFGVRNDFETNIGNVGFGVGIQSKPQKAGSLLSIPYFWFSSDSAL